MLCQAGVPSCAFHKGGARPAPASLHKVRVGSLGAPGRPYLSVLRTDGAGRVLLAPEVSWSNRWFRPRFSRSSLASEDRQQLVLVAWMTQGTEVQTQRSEFNLKAAFGEKWDSLGRSAMSDGHLCCSPGPMPSVQTSSCLPSDGVYFR